jgi:hypothetical protein
MTVARADTESKDSIRRRVKQMAWSDEYFERLVWGQAQNIFPVLLSSLLTLL